MSRLGNKARRWVTSQNHLREQVGQPFKMRIECWFHLLTQMVLTQLPGLSKASHVTSCE
jgi:hypothetical protein